MLHFKIRPSDEAISAKKQKQKEKEEQEERLKEEARKEAKRVREEAGNLSNEPILCISSLKY